MRSHGHSCSRRCDWHLDPLCRDERYTYRLGGLVSFDPAREHQGLILSLLVPPLYDSSFLARSFSFSLLISSYVVHVSVYTIHVHARDR